MPATLKRNGQVVVTPRALERQALHELDDGRLVLEHLSGDHQAFGTLVDRYQTRLLNFINRTIGDRERAEDLVQEVFIRVFRHLHRFDQTKKFSTWIYTIASNLAKNELRNRSREALGGRPPAAPVRRHDGPARRPVPQAVPEGSRGPVRGPAAHPPSGRVRAPRAGRQELRRDRRHYGLQPGHREEPPQSGPEQLRPAHRAPAGLGTPQALTPPPPPCQGWLRP